MKKKTGNLPGRDIVPINGARYEHPTAWGLLELWIFSLAKSAKGFSI